MLVHELGHLATIAGYVEPKANCSTFVDSDTNECAIDGSFAADFVQRFWPKASQDQAQRNQQSYFRANRDSFVDDYAATNPFEDMAETFAYYVCDYEVMGRVAKAKVSMFAADPVMAGYRADDTRNGVNCG